MLLARSRRADLLEPAGHVERQELRPVVERLYPLAEGAEAHRAVEGGHARGRRVVRVAD